MSEVQHPTPTVRVVTGDGKDADRFFVEVHGDVISPRYFGPWETHEDAFEFAQAQRERYERVALIAGLRGLADWLDANPVAPTPRILAYLTLDKATARERMVELVPALGLTEYNPPYKVGTDVEFVREFPGDVAYSVRATQEAVCTPTIEDGKVVWTLPDELRNGRCHPAEDRHYFGSGDTCDCGAAPTVSAEATA